MKKHAVIRSNTAVESISSCALTYEPPTFISEEAFVSNFSPEHIQEALDLHDDAFREHPISLLRSMAENWDAMLCEIRALRLDLTTVKEIKGDRLQDPRLDQDAEETDLSHQRYLTVSELAKYTGVSEKFIYKYAPLDCIPGASKAGTGLRAPWRFDRRAIDRAMNNGTLLKEN